MAQIRDWVEQAEPAVTMSVRQLAWAALTGAVVGVAAWLLELLLSTVLFRFIFCHDTGLTSCTTANGYAEAAGLLIATGLGVWGLVRIQVFRPLFVGLAAGLTLWGVLHMLAAQPWYVVMILAALLFAVAYALFAWVMRLRSMLWAIIISLVILIAARFVLNS